MIFVGLAVAGILAAVFAFLTLFQKTLYAGALCLLGVLLQVAIIYFLLGAQLLALIQILVYAGAVMVLIVVAVMAAPPRLKQLWADIGMSRWLAAGTLAVPASVIGFLCARAAASVIIGAWAIPSLERDMAGLLFGPYALLTETAGLVILLSALALIVAEH